MKWNELVEQAFTNAKEKGFHEDNLQSVASIELNIVAELGEAMEAYRSGRTINDGGEFKGSIEEEIADFFIRLADQEGATEAGCKLRPANEIELLLYSLLVKLNHGIDPSEVFEMATSQHPFIIDAIKKKLEINKNRPYKHGKKL